MTPVHIVQQTAQSPQGKRPGLQAGSVVTARVVQALGGGKYAVSLGGQMISVRSALPMQPGKTFSAKIGLSGNQVVLSLVGNEKASPLVTQFTSASLEQGINPQLSQLLASLGLPPTEDAFHLLQFARAMGMKLEARQLRKALTRVEENENGGEDVQTALVMDEKGMGSDAVQSVRNGMGSGQKNSDEEKKNKENDEHDGEDLQKSKDAVQADVNESELVREYFSSVNEAAGKNEIGALSFFNSLHGGEKASDASRWIMLPFEWTLGYQGIIRILTEKEQKKIREIIINAKNLHTSWNFVVYCKQGNIDTVRFSRFPLSGDGEELARELQKMLLPVFSRLRSVEYVAELEGWCKQDFPVERVGGLV